MRTLPLVPVFKDKLLQLKEKQAECRRVCGKCYDKRYLEYICVDEMGTLISPHYLTSAFPKLLAKNNPKLSSADAMVNGLSGALEAIS